jgi:thymidylate synthase (FAD)
MSGRYTELEPVFFVPDIPAVRRQIGKPGNYSYEPLPSWTAGAACEQIENSYEHSWSTYQSLLDAGVAKEVARVVLPVGIFTRFYWTVNARSLMNFLELRTAKNAMREIRVMAAEVLQIFADKMPVTAEAFEANGRKAP